MRTERTVLTWAARLSGLLVVVTLTLMLFTESGSGPDGVREWGYLALFPVGFSMSYIAAWKWPRTGGWAAIVCMIASQLVIGRIFEPMAYTVWAVLCIPAMLFLLSAERRRRG